MKADLRVSLPQFMAELQRSRGLTTGRIDARFSGYTFDLLEEYAQGDPEGPAVGGAYTALINEYNHERAEIWKGQGLSQHQRRWRRLELDAQETWPTRLFPQRSERRRRSGASNDHQPQTTGPG